MDKKSPMACLSTKLKMPVVMVVMLAATVLIPHTANAQDTVLTGTITDSTDAIVPGVSVTALLKDTGNTFTAVTDGAGMYRMNALRPGVYTVTAELASLYTVKRVKLQMVVG